MKLRNTIAAVIVVICVSQCAVEKKQQYNIPPYFAGERKPMFLANLEKGRLLYKQHCSECHGIYGKGKDSIPNFTKQEIQNYLTAYQINDPNNHAVMKKLLPEELSMIITFLQYRKTGSNTQHTH